MSTDLKAIESKMMETQNKFYRWNTEGSAEFPLCYTEKELRAILCASVRSVDHAITKLKKGLSLWTKYGVYSCNPNKPKR